MRFRPRAEKSAMIGFCLAWLLGPATAQAVPPPSMIELRTAQGTLQGTPLAKDAKTVVVLSRDGRRVDITPEALQNSRKLTMGFRSYAPAEIRAELQKEFRGRLEVHNTSHFIVACPAGKADRWLQRLEELLRSFQHYFSVRGVTPQEPQFPLVVIIFPDKSDFQRFRNEDGNRMKESEKEQLLGYYSPMTNRVAMYDSTASTGGDWRQNESTIIHEISHQYAFNCGLQNRFSQPPKWLTEGLAQLFEAPGLWDSHRYAEFKDRVNRQRLQAFRAYQANGRKPMAWLRWVESDDHFLENPAATSYPESWAFSFFLVETAPHKYTSYLKRTAARPNFVAVSKADRLADFKAAFGDDFGRLETVFLQYMAAIK